MASPADRKMEPGVSSQLWMTHVAFPTLVDYVRGLGSAASRVPVRRHLATCARCASAAASFARLTAIARADVDAEPPDAVVSAAIELFDRRTAVGVCRCRTTGLPQRHRGRDRFVEPGRLSARLER